MDRVFLNKCFSALMAFLIICVFWYPVLANETNKSVIRDRDTEPTSSRLPGYNFDFDILDTAGPIIDSITPNTGTQFSLVNASIYGHNFVNGCQVALKMGGQDDISGSVTTVTNTSIRCQINLAGPAVTGSWNVYVQNPDGGNYTLSNAFIVTSQDQPYPEKYIYERKWGSSGVNDSEFQYPADMACDSNGSVYVVERDNHRVQKFDRNGTFITKWGRNGGDGSSGSGDGEFSSPVGILIDSSDTIFILDTGNNRIQLFDTAGQFQRGWDGIQAPISMAVDSMDNRYVLSSSGTISKYDSDMNLLTSWPCSAVRILAKNDNIYTISNYGWIRIFNNVGSEIKNNIYISGLISGFISDNIEKFFAVSPDLRKVTKYDQKWSTVSSWGTTGDGDGQFNNPLAVAVNRFGEVFVSDGTQNRVQKFIPELSNSRPFVVAITPNHAMQSDIVNCSINGAHFQSGVTAYLRLSGQDDIEAKNLALISDSNLTCTFDLTGPAAPGSWSVVVVNPDKQEYILADSFAVNTPYQPYPETYQHVTDWGGQGAGTASFNAPGEMALDTSGNIYVSDMNNHRIQVLDPTGTFIKRIGRNHGDGSYGSNDGEFTKPRGIAFNNSGFMFVCDSEQNRVQVFDPSGNFVAKWGKSGVNAGEFSSSPIAITIDSDDSIYIGELYGRVQKFDKNHINATVWPSVYGTLSLIANSDNIVSLSGPIYSVLSKYNNVGSKIKDLIQGGDYTGITFDSDSNLYICSGSQGSESKSNVYVQKRNVLNTVISQFASYGEGNDGQFLRPHEIIELPDRRILVSDEVRNIIQVFEPKKSLKPPLLLNLTLNSGNPSSLVACTLGGNYFQTGATVTLSKSGNSITGTSTRVISPDTIKTSFSLNSSVEKGFWDVAVQNPDGQISTLAQGFEIKEKEPDYDETFAYIGSWGSQGSHPGDFNYPSDIAFGPDGSVYVSDTNNHRIQKFSSDGTFIQKWGRNGGDGSPGIGNSEFNHPQALAVDASGSIYVCDNDNYRIQKFYPNGSYIAKWGLGRWGSGPREFTTLADITFDSTGNIYTLENTGPGRIQKFNKDMQYQKEWSIPTYQGNIGISIVDTILYAIGEFGYIQKHSLNGDNIGTFSVSGYPAGISVDQFKDFISPFNGLYWNPDGRSSIYVKKYAADGTVETKWGSYGMGPGQFLKPKGVAVDSNGIVFIVDQERNSILRFESSGARGRTLTSVNPRSYVNTTNEAIINIKGTGFVNGMNLTLRNSTLGTIHAYSVVPGSAVALFGKFDLYQEPLGVYDLIATWPDGMTCNLNNSVTISPLPEGVLYQDTNLSVSSGVVKRVSFTIPGSLNNLFVTLQKTQYPGDLHCNWDGTLKVFLGATELKSDTGNQDEIIQIPNPVGGTYTIEILSSQSGLGVLTVYDALPELPIGDWTVEKVLRPYGSVFNQVTVPGGQTSLRLDAQAIGMWSNFRVYQNYWGSNKTWIGTGGPDAYVEIPNPSAGLYVLSFQDTQMITGTDQKRDVLLKANLSAGQKFYDCQYNPHISSYSPQTGSNTGNVTLKISGRYLGTNVTLVGSDNSIITASNVSASYQGGNYLTVSAVFNLVGKNPGQYTLHVNGTSTNAIDMVTGKTPFTITGSGKAEFFAEINGREKIRYGYPAT